MKELNINGANIDLVSYAHQQDSGKNFDKEVGNGNRSRAVLLTLGRLFRTVRLKSSAAEEKNSAHLPF